jgi:hypothetical protein
MGTQIGRRYGISKATRALSPASTIAEDLR